MFCGVFGGCWGGVCGAGSEVGIELLRPPGGALGFVVVVGCWGRLVVVAGALYHGCCGGPGSASVGGCRVGRAGGLSLGLVSTQYLQLLNIS